MLVDTSQFPVGVADIIDYVCEDDVAGFIAMAREARAFVDDDPVTQPIAELVLAFGIESILALFLVRFTYARKAEDRERWVVVGNLPSMHFETDDTPTPALALRLYCAIAQDWADNVLAGADLSDSYPIPVRPTPELAKALLSHVDGASEDQQFNLLIVRTKLSCFTY